MDSHILIAEKQEVLRKGLCAIFEENTPAVTLYEAAGEQELRMQLRQHVFDMVIVNQELISDVKILPVKGFVILAAELDMAILKSTYKHGSLGYLSLSTTAEMILGLLNSSEKSFFVDPSFTPMLMEYIVSSKTTFIREELLTPREREIIYLLRQGLDRPSIARHLSIAETTLKTHIKNIARKSDEDQSPRTLNIRHKSWR